MKFCRFLSWSSGYEMHPSPSVCDHWNRRSLNIVVCRLFIEARVYQTPSFINKAIPPRFITCRSFLSLPYPRNWKFHTEKLFLYDTNVSHSPITNGVCCISLNMLQSVGYAFIRSCQFRNAKIISSLTDHFFSDYPQNYQLSLLVYYLLHLNYHLQ